MQSADIQTENKEVKLKVKVNKNQFNQSYLDKLDNEFASERRHFRSILQLTVTNTEWNNFVMSNASADFGKYVKTIDDCYLTVQNHVKNLHKATQIGN